MYLPERLWVRDSIPNHGFAVILTDDALYDRACGPSGTGCACPKDKCKCAECPNKAHTDKVRVRPLTK